LVSNHADEAVDLFIKGRTANPRIWTIAYGLAGALALKGDLDAAKAVLAETLKLKPEINSLAQCMHGCLGPARLTHPGSGHCRTGHSTQACAASVSRKTDVSHPRPTHSPHRWSA